jgi:hypothetical protein
MSDLGEHETYRLVWGIEGNWINRDDVMVNYEEVSVEVMCDCGNRFWIYVPDCSYQCQCGNIYQVTLSVKGISYNG